MKMSFAPIANPATGRNVRTATATATGVKVGGKVIPTGEFFGMLDKSTARKLRKQLRNADLIQHASAKRSTVTMDR